MAITKVNLPGWGFGDKLASAQINSFDTKIITALDKTTAGDQLAGVVTMAATAALRASTSGAKISATVSGAKIEATTSGATIEASGGADIIVTGAGSTLATASGGRISLGDNDYPVFSSNRSIARVANLAAHAMLETGGTPTISSGSGGDVPSVMGNGDSQPIEVDITNLLHSGATLNTCTLYMYATVHSNLPAVFPHFILRRKPLGAIQSVQSLSAGVATASPANLAAWNSVEYAWSITCTTNNVIDKSTYTYSIHIEDENGANSAPGNLYAQFVLNSSGIADMRFA